MDTRILCINPGGTSTKIAVYDNETPVFVETIRHTEEEMGRYSNIMDQCDMRKELILDCLKKYGISKESLSAVVGRGGLLPPVKSGAYLVNPTMIYRLRYNPIKAHASNLGAVIAYDIADPLGLNAYIYDSVAVDELDALARLTGFPEENRTSLSHALNTRAVAHKCAEAHGKKYEELTFVVAHLGSGFTLSVHNKGRMTDIVDNDEGPFGPESCGRVPFRIALKISKTMPREKMEKRYRGTGGLAGHLGTSDAREIEKRIADGDERAKLVYETMAYQISKAIGELATTVCGRVDYIIITGGVARSKMLTDWITERVSFIAPVELYPGENEMESLAMGARRVLLGEEQVRIYTED